MVEFGEISIIKRDVVHGYILAGGLGAIGVGQMWIKEVERHKTYENYSTAEIEEVSANIIAEQRLYLDWYNAENWNELEKAVKEKRIVWNTKHFNGFADEPDMCIIGENNE